jgi:hypothetical protein
MAVTSIELQLESENLVYFSGQRVKGALVLQIGLPVIITYYNQCNVCILNKQKRTMSTAVMCRFSNNKMIKIEKIIFVVRYHRKE